MRSRSQSNNGNGISIAKRKREMKEHLEEAAQELLAHFNHRNLDAILKDTRYTLDAIKKRVTSSSHLSYLPGKWLVLEYPSSVSQATHLDK